MKAPAESRNKGDAPDTLSRLKGRHLGYLRGRCFSLRAAVRGVVHVVATQPNARIELVGTLVVIVLALVYRVGPLEWALLVLSCALVLSLEAINTALEEVLDLVAPHYHRQARIAKDAAAGALVFAALGAAGVALAVFVPRIAA